MVLSCVTTLVILEMGENHLGVKLGSEGGVVTNVFVHDL